MKNGGITIEKVHENFSELDIMDTDFKEFEEKQPINVAEAAVIEWVLKTTADTEALWEIPISTAKNPLGFGVSIKYIQNAVGISYLAASENRELTSPIIEKMIEEEILVTLDEKSQATGLENRRKLLNWYRKLSEKEKRELPIFGNKICLSRMSSQQLPIKQYTLKFNAVRSAFDLIHHDLEKLGIIDPNYKSVVERTSEANVNRKNSSESQIDRFNRLASRELNATNDFFIPSKLEPFIQVEQLFASYCKTVASESGKSNYRAASTSFIKFLSDLHGTVPLNILIVFDPHLLSRYRKYLEQKIIKEEISSHYANTNLSAVRKALYRLKQVSDIDYIFFDVEGFSVSRETELC
nr:hypothetical protein [uncultured Psychrobacter sp.]